MTIFLIIYGVGVLFNAIIARLIWSDLQSGDELERIRLSIVVFFVLLSFVTWLYVFANIFASMIKRYFNKRGNIDHDGDLH